MKKIRSLYIFVLLFILTGCQKEENIFELGQKEETEVQQESSTAGWLAGTDLETGEAVSDAVFAQSEVTMVNIWATYCGPCITEMPDLGELSREYDQDKFQVIGVVIDVLDSRGAVSAAMTETADEIIAQTNADYQHVIPEIEMLSGSLKDVYAVPTTYFIDKEGNVIGSPHVGGKDKAGWEEVISQILEEAKAA